MTNSPVARRYAQALFELGVDHDELEALGDALEGAAELFKKSDELRSVLLNPAVELQERRGVIDAIAKKAGWPALVRNFLLLLLDRDRLGEVNAIAGAFASKNDEHMGRARARVSTAVELGDDELDRLREQLAKLTGKDVIMTTEVDESLIGGVVARVESKVYDGSLRNHLQRMREKILKEV